MKILSSVLKLPYLETVKTAENYLSLYKYILNISCILFLLPPMAVVCKQSLCLL